MTIKIDSRPKVWKYTANGSPRELTTRDYDQVDAVFSRRRPSPLTPTPMVVSRRRFNPSSYPMGVWAGDVPAYLGASNSRLRGVNPSAADIASANLEAASSLTGSAMNLGETLGSARETMSMVAKRAFQVASLFNAIRRGRWDDAADLLGDKVPGSVRSLPANKRLAQGFLEFQFGWRPLMSDIHDAIDVYRSNVVTGQKVSSRGTRFQQLESNFAKEDFTLEGGITSRVYGTVSNPNVRTLNALGLANPLLTAWELTPFSFVVDWFLPISDILAYLSSELGLREYYRVDHHIQVEMQEWLKQGTWVGYRYTKTISRRVSLTPSVSWPDLTWRGFNASINRVATATALIRANVR